MNQATNNPSDPFVTKSMLDARIEETEVCVAARFDMVDFRFNALEAKMDAGFARMDEKYDRIMNAIDGFIRRVENIEANDAARDTRLDRHERWHRRTAANLHLKLE
jgi:hypothetical protein